MSHAKFKNYRPPGSRRRLFKIFVIYSHGGHLCHVTMTVYAKFYTLFLRMLHIKVQVDKDQEKAQSEKDSHSKNPGGKKTD